MTKKQKALISFAVIIAIIFLLSPIQYIEVSNNVDAAVYERIVTRLDASLTVKYTHSVMKTPVYEHYQIMPDKRIMLKETEFSSYGAGLPEVGNHDFEMTSKGFRVYNINRPFDFLVYRTAPVETGANVTLVYLDRELPFLSFSPERTPVRLTIKSDPMLFYRIREGSEWLMKRSSRMILK